MASCKPKVLESYVLHEKDLVPEGIGYSKKRNKFYLTSIAKSKIIEVDADSGHQRDFINERTFNYSPGAGIHIDDELDILYAIGGYYMKPDSTSSLFAFDLDSKLLIKRYDVLSEGDHFLNDLVQDTKGNIYMSDTKSASIYLLKSGSNTLELFYKSSEISFANGITISDDNTKLYIASFTKGIRVLDISTKKILNEQDSLGISQGIDGLKLYQGNLLAIQNGVKSKSFNFRKLILNSDGDKIVGYEIISENNKDLELPLTFCMAGNRAVVIANSNLQYLNQETFEFMQSDTILNTKLLVYDVENAE